MTNSPTIHYDTARGKKLIARELEKNKLRDRERRKRATPKALDTYRRTNAARHAEARKATRANRKVAVLDFETDPFDCATQLEIAPFTCDIYSPELGHNIFWSNDAEKLLADICMFLESVTDPHTIYAHNGGKFDWQFFGKFLKGAQLTRGRAIMSAKLGIHTCRDSMHIIPAALSAVQKDVFDYTKLYKTSRDKYKDEIIAYMKNDCIYLYDNVKTFIDEHGLVVSIGQAAMAAFRKVIKVDRTTEAFDDRFRQFYYGGRVECLKGAGHFVGDYKLYDVNSMYPAVMAETKHPTSTMFSHRRQGVPSDDTFFIVLECDNDGALVGRTENGSLTTKLKHGIFHTTIHEYNVAIKWGKIRNIKIIEMYDFHKSRDFSAFILPLYDEREQIKLRLKRDPSCIEDVRRSLFLKLLMNNCYGKFAQNPRKFMAVYCTAADEYPPEDTEKVKLDGIGVWGDCGDGRVRPKLCGVDYWLWDRPNPGKHFNNVAIAASITGAARAKLLDTICQAIDPIYCDTDSLICKELIGVVLDDSKLGAWALEQQFTEVLIGGKKLYACRQVIDGKVVVEKIRHKGISHKNGLTWPEMLTMVLHGEVIQKTNFAPTIGRDGSQVYITRNIKRTEPLNARQPKFAN
jgi:hypothetical protein